ncbi:VOC family protein [Erythrobacter sp. YT30]|uniref:VOC family protein n=1 Tax=Erythrobacter sp. YT30 TaxID=1735012 RepID=UPI00076C27DA|nr:VOC family protein [Erythrobacter sp. YT30]KWV91051.1 hypothetical protein AUC45_06965 [Erythrobacter sp. YT30]
MTQKIFVNLPVSDLERSTRFYKALGFTPEPRFTDETAAAMVVSETIHVMLLTHAKFKEFAPLPIANTAETTGALIALSLESREAVDEIVDQAVSAGGSTGWKEPMDFGVMYSRAFQDPDGHVWEPMWMDEAAMAQE